MQEDQPKEMEATKTTWMLYVDSFSTNKFSGGGIILVTLEGIELEYAIRFEFKVTNNEAEYEALLTRLRLARALGAKQMKVNSDSQLVVGQVLGEYAARDEWMKQYQGLTTKEKSWFD